MKNRFLLVLVLVAAGFAIVSWTPGNDKPVAGDNDIPAGVAKILNNSCFACHGADGKAMALSHLKLAQWSEYSAEKQADKAADICKMVSAGKMPPKGYLNNNPGAVLTKAQVDSICAWTALVK